jgi:aspartate aminotransferase, mitochondrial
MQMLPARAAGITGASEADKDPHKINLGVGANREENEKQYVPPSVKAVLGCPSRKLICALNLWPIGLFQAEGRIFNAKADKEYLPITGLGELNKLAAKLACGGESTPLLEGRIVSTQSISGTGPHWECIPGPPLPQRQNYLSSVPSWGNHSPLFRESGLEVKDYRYLDKKIIALDFEGLKEHLAVSSS